MRYHISMGSAGKSKKTGSNRKGTRLHKRSARKKFNARHIDQVHPMLRENFLSLSYGKKRVWERDEQRERERAKKKGPHVDEHNLPALLSVTVGYMGKRCLGYQFMRYVRSSII